MTATNTWLQQQGSVQLAMTLLFDGVDMVYTTTSETSAIATSLSATDWDTVKSGLYVEGRVKQEIQAFAPRITTSGMSFTIVDADGTLRQKLLTSKTSDAVTYLDLVRGAVNPSTTTLPVTSTTGFDASGHVYIGHECIAYSSKAGAPDPSFTVSQRGKYSLFGPDGSDDFGRRHFGVPRQSEKSGFGVTPEVRSNPDTWHNRPVALVLQHKETGATSSAWSTITTPIGDADSKVIWTGRIKSWTVSGDGTVTLECNSAHEFLMGHVFSRQFRASLSKKVYMGGDYSPMALKFRDPDAGATPFYDLTGELGVSWSNGAYGYEEVISLIQEQFDSWHTDSTKIQRSGGVPYHTWSIEKRETQFGPRVVIDCTSISAIDTNGTFWIGLCPWIWDLLGFDQSGERTTCTTGSGTSSETARPILRKSVSAKGGSNTRFFLEAQNPPREYANPATFAPGTYVLVDNEVGDWLEQPVLPPEVAASNATGLIKIGDAIFGASKTTLTVGGQGATAFRIEWAVSQDSQTNVDTSRFLELGTDPPDVLQTWVERGYAGDLILKCLLSTGESGYNETDLDTYPAGFGLGLPYELIDVPSFKSLDVPYELLLDKAVPMRQILEEVLSCYNRHIVIRNGRISLTRPGFDTERADDIQTLDESSKASPTDRPSVTYAPEGVLNHVVLHYTTLSGTRARRWVDAPRAEQSIDFSDEVSISRYSGGARRSVEIKARGIIQPDAWQQYVAAPILRYLSNPSATIERTISHRAQHILPGDQVALTDDSIIDPKTGTTGVSGLACWAQSVDFDYATGQGTIGLYFVPSHPARYAKLAPSALVTSYNAGTKTVTCSAHAFSRSTDGVDVSFFEAGDLVQFRERSPDPTSAPDILQDEIASVNSGANTVTLVTGVSFAGGLTYVMEPREVASASIPTSDQRNEYAFLADEDDHLIAGTYAAKTWSGPTKSLDSYLSTTPTYTQEFIRPADSDSDIDEPLSSRKLIDVGNNLNNLLAYVTRNAGSWVMNVNATSTDYRLVPGAIWFPLFGVSMSARFARHLVGKVLIERNAGTTSVKVRSSTKLVTGASASAYSFGPFSSSAEVTKSTAGQEWKDITLSVPQITVINGQIGTWITVEVKNSSGSGFGSVRGLSLVETKLSV